MFERTYTSFVRTNTFDEQCLSFYYYFTDPSRNPTIEVLLESLSGTNQTKINITKVFPQVENKWHKSETSFSMNDPNYAVNIDYFYK